MMSLKAPGSKERGGLSLDESALAAESRGRSGDRSVTFDPTSPASPHVHGCGDHAEIDVTRG